ncbi:MAG: 2-enoyl thioester reductase domain-containing protein [Chlamydiia bacterium]|nr:2-enoyl thioester reductase domain-containing protein [Chlamydiia bacterium]
MTHALILSSFAPLGSNVQLGTLPKTQLAPNQVRVRTIASPINPADHNVIEGLYGMLPSLPAVLGNEGVGEVIEIGAGVHDFKMGDWVIGLDRIGWWCEEFCASPSELFPVPKTLDPLQAAGLSVNPATSFCMLSDIAQLQAGDWIIQNAANSGVGRAVIEIAQRKGWKTLNLVRRPELIPEIEALGGTVCILDSAFRGKEVANFTQGAPCRIALNGTGGASVGEMAKALSFGGTVVTYGAMARQPISVGAGLLIFKDILYKGFWRSQWLKQASREKVQQVFKELCSLASDGCFMPAIGTVHKLQDFQTALQYKGHGKVFFDFRGES